MDRATLILDADDTLWENNVFYERATEAFVDHLESERFDPAQARQTFEQVEEERLPLVGYAPEEFARGMVIAYERLCQLHGRPARPEVAHRVEAIGRRVLGYPLVLLDGVAETLPHLQRRFRLILLTKGTRENQQRKVDRSGLSSYFEAIHIVPEKGADVLRDLVKRHGLDPARTWMVGNSPRSDINPALEAGLGAIHIPYSTPWAYEEVAIIDPDRVVTLQRFSDLLDLFAQPEDTA